MPLVNLTSDSDGLLKLEKQISSFNVFEATGAVRRELRHSDFIGFLFDPTETHRLSDAFYRIFCSSKNIEVATKPVLTVSREWEHIDILVRDRTNKIVLVIENKIDTSEHSEQLQRYRGIIERTFPDYDCYYFYLTKTGEEPSDSHWAIMSYSEIRTYVTELASRTDNDDIRITLTHYSNMIERHFMPNNEIAELCRKIYAEHRHAIDLIFEHRPEGGEDIFDKVRELVVANDSLELDAPDDLGIRRIRFAVRAWDALPSMKTSTAWTSSNRILLFEVQNNVNDNQVVRLKLYIGPTIDPVRGRLLEYVREHSEAFRAGKQGEKWMQVYSTDLLTADDMTEEDRLEILTSNWNRFMKNDFPAIHERILGFIRHETNS